MVLETLKPEWLEHRPFFVFFFGIIYAIIGYGVSIIFFKENTSLVMLFLTTLLVVPSLIKMLDMEEDQERREGIHHFFKNHREIMETYLSLFFGVFFGYVLLSFLGGSHVFDFQLSFLEQQTGISSNLIQGFLERPLVVSPENVLSIMGNNLLVSGICFLLSVFYGAGGIFLLILNASIFARFVVYVIQELAKATPDMLFIFGFFFIHLLPEVTGFLLASIAGGVVSKVMLSEKFLSTGFKNVMGDALVLLFLSILFIVIAAFLEVYVTTSLFYYYF